MNNDMKKIFFLLFILGAFSCYSQKITEMKIIPSSQSESGECEFVVFTKDFGGDCSTYLTIDSVKSSIIYISGKYDSNTKCMGGYKSDTISLGMLSDGNYSIHFSLIDTYIPIEGYYIPPQIQENYEYKFSQSLIAKEVLPQNTIIKNNPIKDILYMDLPNQTNEIKIIDTQGKIVLQTECGETATINVSMLPKGVYSIIVNNTASQTFIKQ